jgi:CubicO group peptidase (beta-lactamase class C family)
MDCINRVDATSFLQPLPSQFQEIDQTVAVFAKETGFEGLVAVRIKDQLYTKEVGRHFKEELFPICSITKTFTAAAILKLVEEGKLSLDDKVSDWVKDPKGIFQEAAIGELLTHTSGIPDLNPDKIALKEAVSFEQIYQSLEKGTERGQEKYNNFGYVVLAKVIEKASGRPYNEAMEAIVFGPLGIQAKAPMHIHEMPHEVEGVLSDSTVL